METVKIGLLGLGNIGTGTYKIWESNKTQMETAAGCHFEITKILDRHPDRKRDITVSQDQFTQDPDTIFLDPEIDIVIELLGGIEPATTFMLSSMNNGKHVVTANKAAVAANFDKLTETAKKNGVEFKFEASVGGGIPIINAITTTLQVNEFQEILGILNGTTNYMLTQMTEQGMEYDAVLKDAQAKGFAEADPTADVEGIDVANKLSILIALAFGKYVAPGDIPTEGITKITKEDIADAAAKNCKIKLIAAAVKNGSGEIEYSVKPTALPADHPLAGINDEFNAVFVKGDVSDELMFYGKGAGQLPTGSAVMGDVLQIAKTYGGKK